MFLVSFAVFFSNSTFSSPEPLTHGELLGLLDVLRQQLLQRTSPPKLLSRILTKLGRNDSYMALFKNCSNGSCPLHI